MDRCFLCGRKMLNELQCSNKKCTRNKLSKELQAEYDNQETNVKEEKPEA